MTQQIAKQGEQEPSVYYGTGFVLNEIELGLNVLTRKIRDLKAANERGSAIDQKLTSEQISKVAGQIQVLADVITRVTVSHINRKVRA